LLVVLSLITCVHKHEYLYLVTVRKVVPTLTTNER
jgi:hypothetical protein